MTPRIARAEILLQHARYAEAENELRLELADDPNVAVAHAMLALSLAARERRDEATAEAELAVGLEPEEAHFHYVLARVRILDEQYGAAMRSISEALRFAPEEPEYLEVLARLYVHDRQFETALRTIDRGLAGESDHVELTSLRAIVLTKLGRGEEAASAAEAALRSDPDNAHTHAVRGWTLLERGEVERALEHFRESLRLAPTSEYARTGMLEALKSRHAVYRLLLQFFFWCSRQSRTALWAFMIGTVLFRRVAIVFLKTRPDLWFLEWAVLGAFWGFLALTWLGVPIFNSVLRLNRFGRLVLTSTERLESNVFLGMLVSATGLLGAGLALGESDLTFAAFAIALMTAPVSTAIREDSRRKRRVLRLYVAALAAVCVALLAAPLVAPGAVTSLFWIFLIGWIAFSWVAHAVHA
jgi:tetratricopeptide (TPR) repeat protein